MLTKHDLDLIRAALKFFHEEMSPFAPKLLRHYFETSTAPVRSQLDARRLRAALKACDVRYFTCNPTGLKVLDYRLHLSPSAAEAGVRLARHRLGTALLFKHRLPRSA